MRVNLPITDHEYVLGEQDMLVSVTDVKGRIEHCNQAFLAASGFTEEELIGKAHNIIRHPHMPEEAFRDMWDSISGGTPWTATVKNRRKDGGFYWVKANVTPLISDQQIIGYLSVRSKASAPEIQAADALFKRMVAEKEAGRIRTRMRGAEVLPASVLGRLRHRLRPDLGWKITMLNVITSLLVIALLAGVSALSGESINTLSATLAIGGALAIGLAVGLIQRTMINLRLNTVLAMANQLAACDLKRFRQETSEIGVVGQVYRNMNQLGANLRAVVGDAREQVGRMNHSVGEIASGNKDLSTRTESQAAGLEQTTQSMIQISETVSENADSARQAVQTARDAVRITTETESQMDTLSKTMGEIGESSGKIADIIQVIEGISFQTNLLALNAAVEAARAGEQGRGFAVVAGEVRALSARTSIAAYEVKSLVEHAAAGIKRGEAAVNSIGKSVQRAVESVHGVSELITGVDTRSESQAAGVDQIRQAIVHLDNITQQNVAMVEELAAASNALNEQAKAVSQAMSTFRF